QLQILFAFTNTGTAAATIRISSKVVLPDGSFGSSFNKDWSLAAGESTRGQFNWTIPASAQLGTYHLLGQLINVQDGSTLDSASSSFVIAGSQTYKVVFSETGFPSGYAWSVKLEGVTMTSTNSTIAFQGVPAGPHLWSALSSWPSVPDLV